MDDGHSFYGVELGRKNHRSAASTAALLDVFEHLKPRPSATSLIRIGGDGDGAYLVPDDLADIEACFSPGVNRIKYFEDVLTDRYGIRSHMCDFTCDVDEFTTPLRPGMQTFVKKWLDVVPGGDNIRLDDWIREHDVTGDLLLQMDIEGAEYRNILATPDDTLARFAIVVIEVHGLHRMLDEPVLREVIAPFFAKLANTFTCIHAHPNNCCGDFAIPGTDVRIPRVLELTMVRNDRFVAAPGTPLLPHPLDVSRNVAAKPPLFLGAAWVDNQRSVESRIKMLEDTVDYQNSAKARADDGTLPGFMALTMQSLQTLVPPPRRSTQALPEVAEGQPYQLSSAYGSTSRTGTVKPSDTYFFHTGFGPRQSVRVDLGRRRRVRRIEVTNRRNGHQDRARYLFVALSDRPGTVDDGQVFPMYCTGDLPGGAWQECAIDLPDVHARYVTFTTALDTALHFADLRIYATPDDNDDHPTATLMRDVRTRARRVARVAARRAPRPVKTVGKKLFGVR